MSIINSLQEESNSGGADMNGSWIRLAYIYGIPAALLVFLVVMGATVFATDLAEVKTQTQHTLEKVENVNNRLDLLIKIQRQTCVNTANGDRVAIAGCMVTQ